MVVRREERWEVMNIGDGIVLGDMKIRRTFISRVYASPI
jgi:hypothetical protein